MKKIVFILKLMSVFLSLFFVLLDFFSKKWVMMNFYVGEIRSLLSFLNIYYVHNTGLAFSIFENIGVKYQWFFIIILILIIFFILKKIYYLRSTSILLNIAYAIIFGGAIGNLFDRIIYGVVIDFIDFHIGDCHWPIFNFADIGICLGCVLIILDNFLLKLK